MERNEKSMKNISLAFAFEYLEEVNYAFHKDRERTSLSIS